MKVQTKKDMLVLLTAVRDNDITNSGAKRSMTVLVRKVREGALASEKAVAEYLRGMASRATDKDDSDVMVQLAQRLPAAVQPVAASKTVKAPVTKGAAPKKAVKAVQAVDTISVSPAQKAGGRFAGVDLGGRKSTMESLSDGLDDHALYAYIDAFLTVNDSAPTYNDGPDGLTISFEFDAWYYTVRAPKFNSNGPDDGWIVAYAPIDDEGAEETRVDEDFKTDAEVIDWIKNDTGFKKNAKRPTVRRGATIDPATGVDTTALGLVTSHLVTIASNAAAAAAVAKKGKLSPNVVQALADMKSAAEELRKVIN